MHPKMMIALGNEVERERQNEWLLRLRWHALADRGQGSDQPRAGNSGVRRPVAGLSPRPRLS